MSFWRKPESGSSSKQNSKQKQIVHQKPSDYWERIWEKGMTPWDLGSPAPILTHLHKSGYLPKGSALIPGCGSGYDVAAIACDERFVVGLDLSETCIKLAKEKHSKSPNADYFEFVKADFFEWRPTKLFDLIFDYIFFCAIEPKMRLAWGRKMHELLKTGGILITLMVYPKNNPAGGPPFAVQLSDYEDVLKPGFKREYILENDQAVGNRKEKLAWWKKIEIQKPRTIGNCLQGSCASGRK